MKLNQTILVVSLVYLLLVTIGVFNSCLTFGHGLGDLGMLLILIFLNSIVISTYLILKRKPNWLKGLTVFNSVTVFLSIIYFTLSLTILRGAELPWNGNLFYC
jgi:hypothetical protein